MAIAQVDSDVINFTTASGGTIPALSHSGSNNYVGAAIQYVSSSITVSSVKYGGASGTTMTAVSGASKTQAANGNAAAVRGYGYELATGSSGDNKVYFVLSGSSSGVAEAQTLNSDTAALAARASSGFGQSDAVNFTPGVGTRTITLTASSIPSSTSDVVLSFGLGSTSTNSSLNGITSSTGSAPSGTPSTTPFTAQWEGATFKDTGDSASETAAMAFTAPTYYSLGYGYYTPYMSAVMVGWSVAEAGGGGGTTISATSDSLNLTTYDAVVNASKSITATSDSLTLTEYNADINLNKSISAASDTLILTEYPATVTFHTKVNAVSDSLILTTYDATITYDVNVNATSDSLTLTPYNVTIQYGGAVNISAGVDNLVLTSYGAVVNAAKNISSTSDSLVLTTYDVDINLDKNIQANVDQLTLTAYPATVEYPANVNIQASAQHLVLTEYPAVVDVPRSSKGGKSTWKKKKEEEPKLFEVEEIPVVEVPKKKDTVIVPFQIPPPKPSLTRKEIAAELVLEDLKDLIAALEKSIQDHQVQIEALSNIIKAKDKEIEAALKELRVEMQEEFEDTLLAVVASLD